MHACWSLFWCLSWTLSRCRNVTSLSLFYRYFFWKMFIWSGTTGCPSLFSREVYIFHDFAVTISGCFKDVCANSFFLRTGNFWNFLLMQCFPFPLTLTRELTNTSYLRIFLNELSLCFNLSLVTPCILQAVQSCMEWIPIKMK